MRDLICPVCKGPTNQLLHLERYCPKDCDRQAEPGNMPTDRGDNGAIFVDFHPDANRSSISVNGKIFKWRTNDIDPRDKEAFVKNWSLHRTPEVAERLRQSILSNCILAHPKCGRAAPPRQNVVSILICDVNPYEEILWND